MTIDTSGLTLEQYTAARSIAYSLFSSAFEYPTTDAELDALRNKKFAEELQDVLSVLTPENANSAKWQALSEIGSSDELQIEYTRLFDVGSAGPPCPLFEGSYCDSRMGNLEELIRFYNHFGLGRADNPHELPDHLSAELEFLHFLTHQEALLVSENQDPGDYQRAQRDFLLRHLHRWAPKLRAKLIDHKAMDFFVELASLLEGFINHDVEYLMSTVGRGNQEISIPSHQCIDEQDTKKIDEDDEPILGLL